MQQQQLAGQNPFEAMMMQGAQQSRGTMPAGGFNTMQQPPMQRQEIPGTNPFAAQMAMQTQ